MSDAQIERLAERRRAAVASLRAAQAATRGIGAAADPGQIEQAIAWLRAGAALATREERRRIATELIAVAVLRDGALALDLRIDVPTVQVGDSSGRPDLPVTVPLGRLTVVARPGPGAIRPGGGPRE